MELLYGKPVADEILSRLKSAIFARAEKPGLAVILVGNDSASQIYVNLKEKRAQDIGMNFFRYDFTDTVSQEEIISQIEKLNTDEKVHGIIVQLPLPKGFDTEKIIASIDREKDADGFLIKVESNLNDESGLMPVFPQAIIRMLESSKQQLDEKKAVVLANSQLFGQTMVGMLGQKGVAAELVLAGDISSNLGKIKDADIVVSAMGSPGLIRGEMLKNGAIVIDGGIEKVGEKVLGDVDFGSVEALDGFITPVPGGVGPVTIACLLENVFRAFEAQKNQNC